MNLLATAIFPADGVTSEYSLNFAGARPATDELPYIDRSHIKVYRRVVGTTTLEPLSYAWKPAVGGGLMPQTIVVAPAVATGFDVIIRRETPNLYNLTQYRNVASTTPAALELAQRQLLFATQELNDLNELYGAGAQGPVGPEGPAGPPGLPPENVLNIAGYWDGPQDLPATYSSPNHVLVTELTGGDVQFANESPWNEPTQGAIATDIAITGTTTYRDCSITWDNAGTHNVTRVLVGFLGDVSTDPSLTTAPPNFGNMNSGIHRMLDAYTNDYPLRGWVLDFRPGGSDVYLWKFQGTTTFLYGPFSVSRANGDVLVVRYRDNGGVFVKNLTTGVQTLIGNFAYADYNGCTKGFLFMGVRGSVTGFATSGRGDWSTIGTTPVTYPANLKFNFGDTSQSSPFLRHFDAQLPVGDDGDIFECTQAFAFDGRDWQPGDLCLIKDGGTYGFRIPKDAAAAVLDTSMVAEVPDKRYVTDAEKTKLANTSGTNSGDETAAGIRTKVGNASASNTGVLSSTDWATFNGKQDALPAGTATQFLRGSDKTFVNIDTSVVADSLNRRYVSDAQLTVIGNTSGTNSGDETATSIRSKVGNASSTNTGVLSSTDWATFNGKQDALGFTPENVGNKDTDGTLSANSDTKYPSQKAVKTYSDRAKSTVWRLADGTDVTKLVAFNLSALSTATTRTVTMPDSNVDLGKIISGFSVSGGLMTASYTDGTTTSVYINNDVPIVTSSGLNLLAGRTYQLSDDNLSYTINLPTSPTDGQTLYIMDTEPNKTSRVTRTGVITLNAGATNWIDISGFYHSIALPNATAGGNQRFIYKVVFRASDSTWLRTLMDPEPSYLNSYIQFYDASTTWSSGIPNFKFQFITSGLTGGRSITVPDTNVDLSYVNGTPYNNKLNNNTAPSGVSSAISGGAQGKANKAYQTVITGFGINADGLCPEDAALYGNRNITYSSSKVTGYLGTLKSQSTGTAATSLVTSNNTKLPAYLTKPTGHYAVSFFEFNITMTTSAGATWFGKRRVHVLWDGTTATRDVQVVGADYNPNSHTVTFTATVSSGLLDISVADSTAGGSDTVYWQATLTAHHNGG